MIRKLLIFLASLGFSLASQAQFNPALPFATTYNACGQTYVLQSGTFYNRLGVSVGASLPSCTLPVSNAPSGLLLTLTINLPIYASVQNGQIVRMSFSQAITTLSTTTAGGSILGTLGGLVAGQGIAYICRSANTTWYRLY